MNWEAAELAGASYYANLGYVILFPSVRLRGYDFVAEKNGEFLRVNVKKATFQRNRYIITRSGRGPGGVMNLHVDCYLAWIPEQRRFVELPGNFLDNVKSRQIPKSYL